MRIALGIEYNGHDFSGWQAQKNLLTVQGCLEIALSRVANEPIQVFCAGRTDAGVHAAGQVVHFDTQAVRPLRAWTDGTNTLLPETIAVKWAQPVDDLFHARFSALSRCYHYLIHNTPVRSAISAQRATWYHWPLDAERMQRGGDYLLGEQDFSSFRGSGCEAKSPMRNVQFIQVIRRGEFILIRIQANAFLHHMVRNITGVLLRVGSGLREPEWVGEVLQARDRRLAAETASPTGLYLQKVQYPEVYSFPESELLSMHTSGSSL